MAGIAWDQFEAVENPPAPQGVNWDDFEPATVHRDIFSGQESQPITKLPTPEETAAANKFNEQQLELERLKATPQVQPEMAGEKIRSALVSGPVGWAERQAKGLGELADIGERKPTFASHEKAMLRAGMNWAYPNDTGPSPEEQALGELSQEHEQRRQAIKAPFAAIQKPLTEEAGALRTVVENTPGNETAAKIAESVGGMIPYVAEAAIPGVGPALAVASGGIEGYGSTLEQAAAAYEAQGVSRPEARKRAQIDATRAGVVSAAMFAGLPGIGQSVASRMLADRLAKASPIVQSAVNTLSASAQGGVVMGAQTLIDGAMAKWSYNPDLTWKQALEDAAKSALTGAAATGIIHGGMEATRLARLAVTPRLSFAPPEEPPVQGTWRETPQEFPAATITERTPDAIQQVNVEGPNVPRVSPRQDVQQNAPEIRQEEGQRTDGGGGIVNAPEAAGPRIEGEASQPFGPEAQREAKNQVEGAAKNLVAESTAKEIGYNFKPNDLPGVNAGGLTPDQLAELRQKYPPQWEFTSPETGHTFYMPEGSTREQIVARWNESKAGFEKLTPPARAPSDFDLKLAEFHNVPIEQIMEMRPLSGNEQKKRWGKSIAQMMEEYSTANYAPPEKPKKKVRLKATTTAIEKPFTISKDALINGLAKEAGGSIDEGKTFALSSDYTDESLAKMAGGDLRAAGLLVKTGLMEKTPEGLYRLNHGEYQDAIEDLRRRGFVPKKALPEPQLALPEAQPEPEPPKPKKLTDSLNQKDQDRLAELKAKLRAKMGQVGSGPDPEIIILGSEMAGLYAKAGVKRFADFARNVKDELPEIWDKLKAHLRSIWEAAAVHQPDIDEPTRAQAAKAIDEIDKMAESAPSESQRPDLVQRPGSPEIGNAPAPAVETQPAGNRDRGRLGGNERPAVAPVGTPGGAASEGEGSPGPAIPGGTIGEPAIPPVVGGESGTVRGPRAPAVKLPEGSTPRNYVITEADMVGKGGLKAKFRDNLQAITTLRAIEDEKRPATEDEKRILVRYVGWGGLKGAFDIANKQWGKEAQQLRIALNNTEYEAARRSVLDAHYTNPIVVRRIYDALRRLGFRGGKMIEGGVGIGHFIGLMPEDMRGHGYVGVEKDPITARIAKLLYPEAEIHNRGFEEAPLAKGSFDGAAGNPPFGSQSVFDKNFKASSKFSLHNYFIGKTLELLRPGSPAAFVVSHYFLDSADPSAREYIAKLGKFLGAIRLPNTTFKENANTEVTTDIVFFQRMADGEKDPKAKDWTKVVDAKLGDQTYKLNAWLSAHPEMMLGEPSLQGKLYGVREGEQKNEFTLEGRPNQDLNGDLAGAIEHLPKLDANPYDQETRQRLATPETIDVPVNAKIGGFFVANGRIMRRLPDENMQPRGVALDVDKKTEGRIVGIIGVRDALNNLVRAEQSDTATDAELAGLRRRLNSAYDTFVKGFGYLNSLTNRRAFFEDPEAARVSALERNYDPGISSATAKVKQLQPRPPGAEKASIFEKRANHPYREITRAETSKEALTVSLNQRGAVDLDYMASITGKKVPDIINEIGGLIFKDPKEGWQVKENYLSGNVRQKFAEAQQALADGDPDMARNVEALKAVVPKDLTPDQVDAPLGAPWVPKEDLTLFARELTGSDPRVIMYQKANGGWIFDHRDDSVAATQSWGTARVPFGDMMKLLLNSKPVVVYDRHTNPDGSEYRTLNEEQTALAAAKAAQLRDKWKDWLWQDQTRRDRLLRTYNDTFNNYVDPHHDGSHLTLPGKTPDGIVDLRPHQKNAIWRTIIDPPVYYDHIVGAGKTFAGIASFMEMKRLWRVRKPMFAVPNHLVLQWRDDFIKLYPNANILYARPTDFTKENRQKLFGRIVTGDYDAVIVGHSSLKKIGMSPDSEKELLNEMLTEIVSTIKEARDAEVAAGNRRGGSRAVAALERTKEGIQNKISQANARAGEKDQVATFEELGIDGLFVDEAHEFKNLFYTTQMQNVAGLGNPKGSGRAFDLYLKTRFLRKRYGAKVPIVFASGTPISNSLVEMFTVQRYLQPDKLEAMGLKTLDAWARVFAHIDQVYEVDPTGTGYRLATRFSEFQNVGDLVSIYRTSGDVITMSDLIAQAEAQGKRFPVPKVKGGKPQNTVAERTADQADYFGVETEVPGSADAEGNPVFAYPEGSINYRVDNMPDDPRIDNMLKLTNDARKAGLDMRLIRSNAPDNPNSKINVAVKNIVRIHRDWRADKGAQLVFCDLSVPASARDDIAENVVYRDPSGKLTEARGRPVEIPHQPEWAETFSLKVKGEYQIVEKNTGLVFGKGLTRAKAFEAANGTTPEIWRDAEHTFRRHGELTEDQVLEYLEKKGEDENSVEQGITMDELLAAQSKFSVYDDMKAKLIKAGVPAHEIAFIHDYDTPEKKSKLFAAVRRGDVRVLFGSTPKLGAGTNVQTRLVALHHLDAPWRPSDLEQREGRIIRQENELYKRDPDNFEVEIHRYATNQTYDTRMWQLIEHKARGIEGFRTADRTVRRMSDIAGEAANAADMKAAASGNPLIQKELELRNDRARLEALERAARSNRYQLEDQKKHLLGADERYESARKIAVQAIAERQSRPKDFTFTLPNGKIITERDELLTHAVAIVKSGWPNGIEELGKYRGYTFGLGFYATRERGEGDTYTVKKVSQITARLAGATNGEVVSTFHLEDTLTGLGIQQRMDNWLDGFENRDEFAKKTRDRELQKLAEIEKELARPNTHGAELQAVRTEHERIRQELMQSRKKKPAVTSKVEAALDKAIEALKPDPTQSMEGVTGLPVWLTKEAARAALMAVRAAYRAGKHMTEAVKDAVDYVRGLNLAGFNQDELEKWLTEGNQKHGQIAGVREVGPLKEVESIARITDAVRSQYFDHRGDITPEKSADAWDLATQLTDPHTKGRKAGEIMDIGGGEMAPGLLRNELWYYGLKMASQGDPALLRFLYDRNEDFATIGGGKGGDPQAARVLRAALERSESGAGLFKSLAQYAQNRARTAGKALKGRELYYAIEQELTNLTLTPAEVDEQISKSKELERIFFEPPAAGEEGKARDEEIQRRDRKQQAVDAEKYAQKVLNKMEARNVEWIRPDRPKNLVAEIIKDELISNADWAEKYPNQKRPGLPVNQPETYYLPLRDKFVAVGVEPATALRLAREVYNEVEARLANKRQRQIDRASQSRKLGALTEDLLNTPYRAQQDPAWRQRTAEDWFLQAGLSRDQAIAAAKLYSKQFEAALQTAAERAATRLMEGKTEPHTIGEVIKSIRLGLTDPARHWSDAIAQREGFRPLSAEQHEKLADYELKASDPSLSPQEKAAYIEQMISIFRHAGSKDGLLLKTVAESFTASLLSGIRTATIQLEPVMMTLRDFPLAVVSDPKNGLNMARAMVRAYKEVFRSEFKFSWQHEAYGFHLTEPDRHTEQLKRVWEEADRQYKTGTLTQKATARLKQLYAMQQFVGRFLNTIDQSMMATTREWKLAYYASSAFKEAGLGTEKIKDLVDVIARARQSAFESAIEQGYDANTAKVRANWDVGEAVQQFMANTTGSESIANKVLKSAENDIYSTVGRRASGIKESDEGMLSRGFMNPLMEWISSMRAKGGVGSIVSTALFGFVNIPYRTTRYWAQFGPYGLLREGVHHYRVSRGLESFWKQSHATEMQCRARLYEAIGGTLAFGLATAWGLTHSTADPNAGDDKFGIYVTGQGPSGRVLRDAWAKNHWQPYALNFVIGGHKVAIPLTRVGEAIMFPFLLAAAADDAQWRKKEIMASGRPAPAPLSNYVTAAIGEIFSMTGQRGIFQGMGQMAETMRGGGGALKQIAKTAATVASAIAVPFKQLLAGISDMFIGPMDQSSATAIIAANFPIVGLPFQTRAVNRFGDELYDRSWYGRIARTGVPIVFQVSKTPENEQLYSTLIAKGAAPPELRRSVLEEKYGPLTDSQFQKFAKISGETLKAETLGNLPTLQGSTPNDAKKLLAQASTAANRQAASALGLETVKSAMAPATATAPAAPSVSVPAGSSGAAARAPAPSYTPRVGPPRIRLTTGARGARGAGSRGVRAFTGRLSKRGRGGRRIRLGTFGRGGRKIRLSV